MINYQLLLIHFTDRKVIIHTNNISTQFKTFILLGSFVAILSELIFRQYSDYKLKIEIFIRDIYKPLR